MDVVYTARFLNLLRKPFEEWGAFNKGIIDKTGKVVKRKTDDDWTKFHQMVASVKKILNKGSSKAPQLAALYLSFKTLKEEYNLDVNVNDLCKEFPLFEDMVAGDAGGDPTNIASGKNSGAVVNKNPQTLGKKKRKKMNEVMTFCQFQTDIKETVIAKEVADKEQAEKMNEVHSFSFKAIGANSVVVEASEIEVKSVSINGHASSKSIVEAELVEAFKEHGKDGVLAYIKEVTNLVWKTI